jgi:hypothetical protein
VRFYGSRFWALLPIGLAPALLDLVLGTQSKVIWVLAMETVGAVVMTAAYIRACVVLLDPPGWRDRLWRAFAVGVVAFLPFPPLFLAFLVPGLAWFALVGLAVPVVLVENVGFRQSFRRAVSLAQAGFGHAFGSLTTLVVVYFLSRTVLAILLRGQDQTERIALFLADVALSPLLFIGGAMLFLDQSARRDAVDSGGPPVEEA